MPFLTFLFGVSFSTPILQVNEVPTAFLLKKPTIIAEVKELSKQDLSSLLVRAQYSASIGGHNEPIRGVITDYKTYGSNEWFSVTTNENGQAYIALEPSFTYELKIQYDSSQDQFLLEYGDQDTLMISIDINNKNIVDCRFISAHQSINFDPPLFSFLNFTLHLSHFISFLLGLILSIIFIYWRINK